MSKREPGLDLLRCIALLFVVTFHSFLNNGYYSEPQVGVSMWLAGSFRWLSVSCIGLFLMLTGYLKCEKTDIKACYNKGIFWGRTLKTQDALSFATIADLNNIRPYQCLSKKVPFTAPFYIIQKNPLFKQSTGMISLATKYSVYQESLWFGLLRSEW